VGRLPLGRDLSIPGRRRGLALFRLGIRRLRFCLGCGRFVLGDNGLVCLFWRKFLGFGVSLLGALLGDRL
jgi:hypothetical protein